MKTFNDSEKSLNPAKGFNEQNNSDLSYSSRLQSVKELKERHISLLEKYLAALRTETLLRDIKP